jgi:hypothetical protein
MCEIAAITLLAALVASRLQDNSEAWMAVVFFAVFGGFAWVIGRSATTISG